MKTDPRFPKLHIVDHPLVQHKLSTMREKKTPSNSFRQLLRELTYLIGYEVTRDLPLETRTIDTPLCKCKGNFIKGKKLVIIPILRAGLGMSEGLLDLMPSARVGHIGLYRGPDHKPVEYLVKLPSKLEGRRVILCDPMLATGSSLVMTYNALVEKAGMPKFTHVATVIGSEEGVEYAKKHLSANNCKIWCGSLDAEMTVKSYIVPGLGDAGDLAYGEKL